MSNIRPSKNDTAVSYTLKGKSIYFVLFCLIISCVTSGCGTLFYGSREVIEFNSNPPDAKIFIDGAEYGITPVRLSLKKGKDRVVTFKKEGYSDKSTYLDSQLKTMPVVLDFFAGIFGIFVDYASGGLYEYERKSVSITLEQTTQK
ncbi:MAG: PEGA domain-containing protein [Planctomycetes bacterium]|nr:PEGA domain-containing protein [Planctomycetota bacterium]